MEALREGQQLEALASLGHQGQERAMVKGESGEGWSGGRATAEGSHCNCDVCPIRDEVSQKPQLASVPIPDFLRSHRISQFHIQFHHKRTRAK